MSINISKYFWNLNAEALKETGKILKNPGDPKFIVRMITLLSRCDKPKELFSIIPERVFIESWPKIRVYWQRIGQNIDFKNWWETIYEQLLQKYKIEKKQFNVRHSKLFFKIGKIIRTARISKNLSQNDLALRVGMRQPDISNIEEGKKNITLETLICLCKALGIEKIDFSET